MPVKVYQSFEDLPESLINLNSYPAQRNYFLSNQWFSILYDTVLSSGLDLRVYVVFSDDSDEPLEGALFCGCKKNTRTLVSLTNYYTLAYGVIRWGEPSDRLASIDRLVEFIRTEKPAWESIDLRYLQSESREYDYLVERLTKAGFYTNRFFQYENWFYPLNGEDFLSYYEDRPSKLKNTIKRKAGKLKKSHHIEIRYYTRNDAELESGIRAYTTVANRSWKMPEPYAAFIPALIKSCANQGILLLGVLFLDSRPVAAQFWLTTCEKWIIYKLSYDEEYKACSVGSILSKEMFEQAFARFRSREIDYGIGSEAYKRDWMSRVRGVGGIVAYNKKTMKGLFLAAIQYFKDYSRKLVRRGGIKDQISDPCSGGMHREGRTPSPFE